MADSKQSAQVRYWLNEIQDARKREKTYRKEGQRIIDIYSGRKNDEIPFNILYSNTETLSPALYGQTPKPVVQRRYKDDDPTGRDAATVAQRTLEFLLDTNVEGYETFDNAMGNAVLDGLLPGRGVTRVKYEAEITDVPDSQTGEAEEADSGEGANPENGADIDSTPVTTYEMVCTETVEWDRVLFGYAKRWSKMPWVSFEHYLDKSECTRLFGAAKAEQLKYASGKNKKDDDNADNSGRDDEDENQGERKTTLIYEIWYKKKKCVYFISPKFDAYLKEEDDPLELTGFYPIPKPVMFLAKSSDLLPTALYHLYENQAKELNRISVRINRIVDALKVRGAYDGSLGDTLRLVFDGEDNTLVPTDNASNIAMEGGLEKYIWLLPLDKLVQVLQQLIVARNEAKQIIYEVTGIADVLRGATDPNETLGAQTLKSQWASQRLKQQQNEVRRYVREMLRLMVEIAAKKFSHETFAAMTGLPFVSMEQKQQAIAALKQQAMQAQMMAQQAPQAPQGMMPGVPPGQAPAAPPMPPPDPQLLKIAQSQDWDSVLKLLQDDMQRSYRIDIETNSTIQVNEQEDKKNITEALNAIGQFLSGVSPLVEQGMMDFSVAQAMLLTIVRRFQFGTEIEDQIKAMKPPQPKPDPKIAAEQQKLQAQQQQHAEEAQRDAAAEQAKLQREMQAEQNRTNERMAELQFQRESEGLNRQEESQRELQRIAAERESKMAELQVQKDIARMEADMQQKTELQKISMTIAGQIEIANITAQKDAATANAESAAEGAQVASTSDSMTRIMERHHEQMMVAITALSAPKDVVRDKNGRAISIVPRAAA
jgi:hypothetical protein